MWRFNVIIPEFVSGWRIAKGRRMVPEREPANAVCHAVRLYDRGIICPADMWFQVVRVLSQISAESILDSLPIETRGRLRSVFADRPSLPADGEFAPANAKLVAWLEQQRD